MLPGIVTPIVRGIGEPKYEMQTCLFIAIANVLLSTVLILKVGFIGALIGTSLSMSTGYAWYLIRFNKFIKEPFIRFVRYIIIKPIVGSGIGSIAILVINNIFLMDIFENQSLRGSNFITLSLQVIIFAIIYSGTLILTKHFDKVDILVLRNVIKTIRRNK
jgi:peptidoglycan biosynthesis protein MviN/MurJ (putative lipid II flippase)